MKTLNVSEAKARFSSVVESAAAGEEVIVTKMGKPVAKVVPYSAATHRKRIGLMRGKIRMAKDFDSWGPEEAKALGIVD